ncbi:MAG: hypothetical protein ACK5MX_12385 [Pseudanabaena sp.]
MNNPIEVSLRRHFEGVEDPRDNRGKEHGTGQLKRDRRICVFFVVMKSAFQHSSLINRPVPHNLLDIIVIAICTVISGGENFDTKHYLLMVILLFQQ